MSVRVEVGSIVYHDGTVTVAEGVIVGEGKTPVEGRLGRHVRFAGDRRPMADIEAALERGETVVVQVEAWQFI